MTGCSTGTPRPLPAGDGWLAIGDAAICFDPLASNGLLSAFETAAAAADAAVRLLDGDDEAAAAYDAHVAGLWRSYRQAREAAYAIERRWAQNPFWSRRLAG